MPRGRPRAKKTAKETVKPTGPSAKKAASSSQPRRGPPRGARRMEGSKTDTRKRKQAAADPAVNGGPPSKKAKATTKAATKAASVPVEETDRAVEVVQRQPSAAAAPPLPAAAAKAKTTIKNTVRAATRQSGRVFVMGQGDTGQLGLGDSVMERSKPFPVGGAVENLRVVQVTCGGMHTAALTDSGKVFTWGCNDEGALGRDTKDGEEYTPGQVLTLKDISVVRISAGDSHTVALASNGDVYCWGVFRDSNGPFGLLHSDSPSASPTPCLIYSSPSNQATKIASGNDHVALLTANGDIITFGCAEQGQLGRVPEIFSSRGGRKGIQFLLKPTPIRFRKSRNIPSPHFQDVFCGSYHTFALTEDEAVYCWGLNNYGQLGTGDMESRFQPERLPAEWVKGDVTDSVVSPPRGDLRYKGLTISGGQHHSVLCNKGSVYVMGRREYGRLGLGTNSSLEPTTPTQVPGLDKIAGVSASTVCSFAVSEGGDLYSWGMGTNLQLGTGDEDDVWKPHKVTGKKMEGKKVVDCSAGGQHTALLVE